MSGSERRESDPGDPMERFNPDLTLTSTETADLLEVHPSTVKRWCNDGELLSAKTSGGHRRLHLEDIMEFARQREIRTVLTPFHPYEPHVWTALREIRQEGSFRRLHDLAMGWVGRGQLRRLGLLFETLGRDAELDLCTFCDQGVRGLMRRVGVEWAQGRLRVGDEHLVSQIMSDVLVGLRPDPRGRIALPRNGKRRPVAVVGAMEGNQHGLGSLCVRLVLERLGWDVLYLGPDVPFEDFGALQRSRGAALVCVSLKPPAAAGDLARAVRTLGGVYDAGRPYSLVFGGVPDEDFAPTLLDGPFRDVAVLDSSTDLCRRLGGGDPCAGAGGAA